MYFKFDKLLICGRKKFELRIYLTPYNKSNQDEIVLLNYFDLQKELNNELIY